MSDRLFVSTRKGLFRYDRSSSGEWKVEAATFLGDNVTLCLPLAEGKVLAALDHGHFGVKVHRSTDEGASFTETTTPKYPEKPEGLVDLNAMTKEPLAWNLKLIWSLESGGPDQRGRIWVGTIPGGLFRSDDEGESWELVRSLWDDERRQGWFGGGADLPGIHSICVDPRSSSRVLLGVSCGGAWITDDDGASWRLSAKGMKALFMPPDKQDDENTQDPHRIVQCPGQPEVYWCQHHCGVWRSTDEGANWDQVEVPPSSFGFGVAVHPEDGDTAWFVPGVSDEHRIPVDGQVVVARTRDGGKSFDVLREGLPQEHAYDLTYRHALDIDGSGDRLAFGSTTGGLWLTEDQGDHWQCLSANLPPIHAVRFA
ncbi:MAG: exo-alpha-sialidase [Acidobacteriota bacterium]